jgi:RNA polymerase sigma-70 factor, ECF subfamily
MNFSLKRIQSGDLKEFENLFRELYTPLCSYASKILHDNDQAEEIVQDIFYGIWKNKEKLDIHISFRPYLYKSVHNNCLQTIQHHQIEEKYRKHVEYNLNEFQIDPIQEMEAEEMNIVIEKTLNSLPERCKQIFNMSRFEGMKYKEIAEILDISTKTVESNMGKALNAFRQNLRHYVGANI